MSSILEELAKILNVEQNDITISKMQEYSLEMIQGKLLPHDRILNLLKGKVDKASTTLKKINFQQLPQVIGQSELCKTFLM